MRFAHRKVSPIKSNESNNHQLNIERAQKSNPKIEVEKMFIHYSNSIYMGGVVSFKKNGKGILLMDDGTSAITNYSHDNLIHHNIFYRDNSIISVLHLKNNIIQFAIRKMYILMKLSFLQQSDQPNGDGIIIDYQNKAVYHIIYHNGKIIKKIAQTNKQVLQKVFEQHLQQLFDVRHIKAFSFDICNDGRSIKLLRSNKRITIGYADHRNDLQGLAFKLKINEEYDNFSVPLDFHCIQRGFYQKSRLQNYGQRFFSNGNLYIGEFKDDYFSGKGLLLYPNKQKWAYGIFENDQLKKILQVSVEEISCNSYSNPQKLMKEIHKQNNEWISSEIHLFNWQILNNKCDEMMDWRITDVIIQKKKKIQEQQLRLKKIQDHFAIENPNNFINKVMVEQINKSKISLEKIIINEKSTLKPKILQIQPRTNEHSCFWSKQNEVEKIQANFKSKQSYSSKQMIKTMPSVSPSKFTTKQSKGSLSPYNSNTFL